MTALSDRELELIAAEASEFGIAAPADLPVVRRDVNRPDGGVVSALVWGSAAPQGVFLHGAGLNAHTWNTTVLAGGWPAVALDLPGHGDSSWHDDIDYSPQRLAEVVGDTLDTLAPVADFVVGQSLGGLTGIVLAAERPDLVRALVVVDVSPGLVIKGGNQVRDFLAGAASFASRDEIVERALAFGLGSSRAATARAVELNTRVDDAGRVVFKHHFAQLAALAPADTDLDSAAPGFEALWPAAEALDIPVLLVRAATGFLTDDTTQEFLDRVPASAAVTIDAGHNVQEQRPAELAAAVGGWLAGL